SVDAVAHFRVFNDGVLAGKESIVGIEGGIQKVEAEEFAEQSDVKNVIGRERIAGMHALDALEAGQCRVVVLVIETIESLPDQRVAVERIGVHRFGGGLNR